MSVTNSDLARKLQTLAYEWAESCFLFGKHGVNGREVELNKQNFEEALAAGGGHAQNCICHDSPRMLVTSGMAECATWATCWDVCGKAHDHPYRDPRCALTEPEQEMPSEEGLARGMREALIENDSWDALLHKEPWLRVARYVRSQGWRK